MRKKYQIVYSSYKQPWRFIWDEPSFRTLGRARKTLLWYMQYGFTEDTVPMRENTEFAIMNTRTGEIYD